MRHIRLVTEAKPRSGRWNTREKPADACTPADLGKWSRTQDDPAYSATLQVTRWTPSVLLCKQGVVGSNPIVSTVKVQGTGSGQRSEIGTSERRSPELLRS